MSTDVLCLLCGHAIQHSTLRLTAVLFKIEREKATALSEGGKQAIPLFLFLVLFCFSAEVFTSLFTRSEVPISVYFQRSIQNSFLIFLLPSCQNACTLKYSLVAKLSRRKASQHIFCTFLYCWGWLPLTLSAFLSGLSLRWLWLWSNFIGWVHSDDNGPEHDC